MPRPFHAKKDPAAAETFKRELAANLQGLGIEQGRPVRIRVADEMRYVLQPVTRRVWSLRGTRVVVPVLPRYDWACCYGALEVGGGGAEFFNSPAVNLECSALFLAQIAGSDPQATHVVIWDGAGFHPSDAESGLSANVRLLKLPTYSPELNPVGKLWDVVKEGICNRLFTAVSDLQKALSEVLAE